MSMEYIRKHYTQNARRGARVQYTGEAVAQQGTITGTCGARLRVRMDGEKHTGIYHPTWEMHYLQQATEKSSMKSSHAQ